MAAKRSRPTKRAHVEALGWTFTVVPSFWAGSALWDNPQTGERSARHWDSTRPAAWIATPPPGLPASPRRFDHSSPNHAVRWAWEQARAPQFKPDLVGVAGLVALIGEAQRAGVVADCRDAGEGAPPRPDAELLALCAEVMGTGRVVVEFRSTAAPCPWKEKAAHQRAMSSFDEACRTRDRLLPRVVEVEATTVAGILAKADAVGMLFDDKRGPKAEAVRSLLADLAAVLRAGVGAGGVAS